MIGPLLPKPDRIGLSLMHGAHEGDPAIPAIYTSYQKDAVSTEHFQVITGVKIDITKAESGDPESSDVTMTVIHDCSTEGCPTSTGRVRFSANSDALEPFRLQFEARDAFLWLCTTPSFEGRIVVSKASSRVSTCSVEQRTLQ